MQLKNDYQSKIQNIAKMLPEEKLGEVLDFMEFPLSEGERIQLHER